MKNERSLNVKGQIVCDICPRKCKLDENQSGFCKVRKNINGKITSTVYGYTTGLAIDPIEKKPLFHFYPKSKVLSFGTFGCNMGCVFCQNHHISKHEQDFSLSQKISPEEIVSLALKYNCKSVAFTYNDPIVFLEYAQDTAKICKEKGIKTVAVTAGFMNKEPREDFYTLIDAANIDLKGFSEDFYKKNCLANLAPVLETIKYVANQTKCVLELTTLLIEGENDNYQTLKNEFEWIIEYTGAKTPLHLSAFHPDYKMLQKKKTNNGTLINAYKLAKEIGLKNVYTGNIIDIQTASTICPNCGEILIKRNGFNVFDEKIINGCCFKCGEKIYGEFKA